MADRNAAGGAEGILVVDKPIGPTSHDVVAIVRRLSGVRRVGHGGTLDPFAAGVLPVFLGRATRMVEYHLGDEKAYRAVMVFGARSTTDDLDGELTPTDGAAPSRDAVESALAALLGVIEQTPPIYSAVRIGGRHAYDLARHGEVPALRSRTVTIHAIDVVDWDVADPDRPAATVELRCSAGTYVRAIARDAGDALGTGAYLGALVRTASGPFRRVASHPLDEVRERLSSGRVAELLLPPDSGLEAYPVVHVDAVALTSLARGQIVRVSPDTSSVAGPSGLVRVLSADGRLAAMARLDTGRLHPEKVFLDPLAPAVTSAPA